MSRARENFIAFSTIVRKEVHRFARLWIQTILPSVVTTVLYFLIFGNLIGSRIGALDGHSYSTFIAPGLIMMAVITNTYANVSGSFFLSKFQRTIEEILVSPIPNYLMLLGYLGGGIARGVCNGIIITVVSLFFVKLPMPHWFTMLFVIVLTSALFSLAGFINGMFAKSFDDISIVPTFILTPLTYLGGVFYSIALLPEFWQKASLFNPILYMVNAFRYSMIGVSDINIHYALGMIVFLVVILFGLSLYLLNKGVGIRS